MTRLVAQSYESDNLADAFIPLMDDSLKRYFIGVFYHTLNYANGTIKATLGFDVDIPSTGANSFEDQPYLNKLIETAYTEKPDPSIGLNAVVMRNENEIERIYQNVVFEGGSFGKIETVLRIVLAKLSKTANKFFVAHTSNATYVEDISYNFLLRSELKQNIGGLVEKYLMNYNPQGIVRVDENTFYFVTCNFTNSLYQQFGPIKPLNVIQQNFTLYTINSEVDINQFDKFKFGIIKRSYTWLDEWHDLTRAVAKNPQITKITEFSNYSVPLEFTGKEIGLD